MIQDTRIRYLNDQPHRDAIYVLYWMQEAQRPRNNAALKMAIDEADRYKLPVVVCDRSYMPSQIGGRMSLADKTDCRVIQVETETVIPVEVTTEKLEYGVRTIRPKLHRVWDEYLVALKEDDPKIDATTLKTEMC
ncbi:MAG: hypothetical protein VYA17_01270 [Pseudomonadota bacterium]|nr:hypothetical protein [Pseudomonadota bacterium]